MRQCHPCTDRCVLRWSLAAVWLGTAFVCLWAYPLTGSMALLAPLGVHGEAARMTVIAAALLDAVLGLATLWWPRRALWAVQMALVLGYTAVITCTWPQFWAHPFGPVVKNLPILAILYVLWAPSTKEQT